VDPLVWLTTTDHKRIGVLYMVTTFAFFIVGGALAAVIRLELATPGIDYVSRGTYAELFTIHGTTMIFLFVAPFGLGLSNYLVPLQIGAPDMSFPRLNALSYWLFLAGGLTVYSGFLTGGGSAAWYLRQAALEAVIERRIAVHAVISIHRALLAGAAVPQIAQATGLSRSQIAVRWAAWAGGQVRLRERIGTGMAREEYERAAAVVTGCGGALPDGAVPADQPALPGKRK